MRIVSPSLQRETVKTVNDFISWTHSSNANSKTATANNTSTVTAPNVNPTIITLTVFAIKIRKDALSNFRLISAKSVRTDIDWTTENVFRTLQSLTGILSIWTSLLLMIQKRKKPYNRPFQQVNRIRSILSHVSGLDMDDSSTHRMSKTLNLST